MILLKALMEELGFHGDGPMTMRYDSQVVVSTTNNLVSLEDQKNTGGLLLCS